MSLTDPSTRTIGLLGAVVYGVGAIVGGGIFVLSGVAFAVAGPSALLALVLNGLIAALTVFSFAELAAAFPQSGGIYSFAKRVFSVQAAFTIGWIVWFASIVAGALYAHGFASFVLLAVAQLWPVAPAWLESPWLMTVLALTAVVAYDWRLLRRAVGGTWLTYGKLLAFAVLVAGGLAALFRRSDLNLAQGLSPFFAGGLGGVVAAMGFTFLTVQGFSLIAVIAGDIRQPARTIPRAMFISLAVALLIYLPLLLVISTLGVLPGESVQALGAAYPETVVAVAAARFWGGFGFWLVVLAALLSTLSALRTSLAAASRMALAMARDRTLPRWLSRLSERNVPNRAVLASGGMVALAVLLLPNVATAGAAASLIFLVAFALVHVMSILARERQDGGPMPFTSPLYPLIPLLGAVACAGLAFFQGTAVPAAGLVASIWIGLGLTIYLVFLAQRAQAVDALDEARDPSLLRLRGKSPLVLVPVANPANAGAMVQVASALAPARVGRVLLLSVVTDPQPDGRADALENSQAVLRASLIEAMKVGIYPEALTTLAHDPWAEIARVARHHGCESLLLGFHDLRRQNTRAQLDALVRTSPSDIAILRAPLDWSASQVRRILAPVGGKGHHDVLRARLLGSLLRSAAPEARHEVRYLRVLPPSATDASLRRAERALQRIAEDERSEGTTEVLRSAQPLEVIVQAAQDADLLILGLQRRSRAEKGLGAFALELSRRTTCALIMLSHRG